MGAGQIKVGQIKYDGKYYSVTGIYKKAFYGCTALKSIIISKNITVIGSQAFQGCKNLRFIAIETSHLTSINKNAFAGTHPRAIVEVPSKKLKSYTALLKNKGLSKEAQIVK